MRCVMELVPYKYSPSRVRDLVELITYLFVKNNWDVWTVVYEVWCDLGLIGDKCIYLFFHKNVPN